MHPSTIAPTQQCGLATRQLADFLATTGYNQLPRSVVERATLTIADTIGVGLAGSRNPAARTMTTRLKSGNAASILAEGFPARDDMVATAVANSIRICLVELDEGAPGGGHPALHVLPGILAMAETRGMGGHELIEAFVLGYEAHYRVQTASRLQPNVYPHGNTGTIGAVVGLGKLLGWDGDAMARGITMAAAFPVATSYAPCLSGADVAAALAAVTVPVAFMVVDLVEAGMNGDREALADSFGTILGTGFDNTILVESLGEDFAVTKNHFKYHASCGVIHPVLEAAGYALGGRVHPGHYPPFEIGTAPEPEEIVRVRVVADPRADRLNFIAADSETSAKFSLPFSLAAFLVEGEVTPASYDRGILRDEVVRSLERRIEVDIDEHLGAQSDSGDLARVEVHFRDGRVSKGTCSGIYGRGGTPSTPDDARAKFAALVSPVLGESVSHDLYERLLVLDASTNVRFLLRAADEPA